MTTADPTVPALISRREYRLGGLIVPREVLGKIHKRQCEGAAIEIAVPEEIHIAESANKDGKLVPWKYRGVDNAVLGYLVRTVEVKVTTPDLHDLRKFTGTVFADAPRAVHDVAISTIRTHEQAALSSYEDWLRLVRWCTRRGTAGAHWILGRSASDFSQLHLSDGSPIGPSFGGTIHPRRESDIVGHQWDVIGGLFAMGTTPMVWVDLLMGADQHLVRRDLRATAIDLLASVETFGMNLFIRNISIPDGHPAQRILNRVPMKDLLRFIGQQCGWLTDDDRKHLRELSEVRNGLVHRGASDLLDARALHEFRTAVEHLIFGAEDQGSIDTPERLLARSS